jgi:hypothetical protein
MHCDIRWYRRTKEGHHKESELKKIYAQVWMTRKLAEIYSKSLENWEVRSLA